MDLLDPLIANQGGITRREALSRVSRARIDRAVRLGGVVNWLPGVLVDPSLLGAPMTRLRAAAAYAGGRGVLSHTSALAVWELAPTTDTVHLTVPAGVRLTGSTQVRVHETTVMARLRPTIRAGLPVSGLEPSLVTAWTIQADEQRRASVIEAIRTRRTTAERLIGAAQKHPRLPGRGELLRLCKLLAGGAHSEFEIWALSTSSMTSCSNDPGLSWPSEQADAPTTPTVASIWNALRSNWTGLVGTIDRINAKPIGGATRRWPPWAGSRSVSVTDG